MSQAGRAAWELAFEISPILLTRGIAQSIPGGILPIVALTDPASFTAGLLTGGVTDPNQYFARWYVLPGGTLQNQKIATYPFANQAVAANAVIADVLNVSMMMLCPARPGGGAVGATVGGLAGGAAGALLGTGVASGLVGGVLSGIGGYPGKLAIMTSLQKSIAQHNAMGGTYSVITPAYIYVDCLMGTPGIRDVSGEGETKQKQYRWQWDFVQPQVLTQAAADSALNSLAQKLQKGLPLTGPSQVLGASGLAAGGNISPLTAILPPTASGFSLQVPQ